MQRLKIDLAKNPDRTALIERKSDGTVELHTYQDLLEQVEQTCQQCLASLPKPETATVGIYSRKSSSAIALLASILSADLSFSFLSEDDLENKALARLGISCFFSDRVLPPSPNLTLKDTLEVFARKIYFYQVTSNDKVEIFDDFGDQMNQICYVVTTSGTTSQEKVVRVTFNCILPNITSLQRIFLLDNDVIFSSAPCTFDVFILDVLLAFNSGSALMIMDDVQRFSEQSLDFMFMAKTEQNVSFLQITPSLLQQYGLENIKKMLSPESSLKYLVLGGEQFPLTREVLEWQDWNCEAKKRIFNIYGTTEMSCWAMMHEVTKQDLEAGEVPLGTLLDDTECAFSPDTDGSEEILLTSRTRICFIDDKKLRPVEENSYFAQTTGDIVRRAEGKIFFSGRSNDIVKRFGQRVNLAKIEAIASEVVPSVCVYTRKKVILFCNADSELELTKLPVTLKSKLSSSEIPDVIQKIEFFPLSTNGKVCKRQLKLLYKDIEIELNIEAEEIFLEAINQLFNLKLTGDRSSSDEPDGKRQRTDFDSSFKSFGGTSFDALRISMKLEDHMSLSQSLLPKLLDEKISFRDIYHLLKEQKSKKVTNGNHVKLLALPPPVVSTIKASIAQRFDLGKCIDASPALLSLDFGKFLVAVGSHSHELITIDAKDLSTLSKSKFKDRIESEVSQFGDSGIVGCYDGFLYCYELKTGEVQWKFDTQGMIKSKALVVGDTIIIGNYNLEENLWCLKATTEGVVVQWKKMVGSLGILATPFLIEESSIFIATLDGTTELIDLIEGSTIWSQKFESPIFSSPRKIPERDELLIAEVSGVVHCIDFDGTFLWTFKTDGHVFSSFLFYHEDDESVKILFGCHDKKLRCLNYSFETASIDLVWETETQSQIYGTPKYVSVNSEDFIVTCSTSGFINFLKLSTGSIEHSMKLPGEIFSTPVVFDRTLFVGCRDNFLYCVTF